MKSDTDPLPHMLPPPFAFGAACDALGLTRDDHVILYDGAGLFSAPRGWWMFRYFGHAAVSVLAGGLPAWRAEARPVETGAPRCPAGAAGAAARDAQHADTAPRTRYEPKAVKALLLTRAEVETRVVGMGTTGGMQLADARPAARFTGAAPEPRPGLLGGHVPGSRNVPFASLLAPDGRLLPEEQLRGVFSAAGIDLNADKQRLIGATCGTGVTACIVALAAATLGRPDVGVYDGSWCEWGLPQLSLPIATGEAA